MNAAIAGATGFIGGFLVDQISNDKEYERVSVVSRRPLDLPEKFEVLLGNPEEHRLADVQVGFCALGTTMATAGSKEAFYRVDHDLVLSFAAMCKTAGAHTFVLVSSVGADAGSSNYYLKVKGETEQDLETLGFRSLIILRPSMLMGDRKEFRLGERVGKAAMLLINPILFGSASKYKGIHGRTVAKAMLCLSKEDLPGTHVLEYDQLQAFS